MPCGKDAEEVVAPPTQWMTVKQAAAYVGCHEETIRRAYTARQLTRGQFGIRGVRIRQRDLDDWMNKGAPTKAA